MKIMTDLADKEGWIVSITPSGGWIPTVIAGNTGVGLSQRAQSFVLYEDENPYNVIEPSTVSLIPIANVYTTIFSITKRSG